MWWCIIPITTKKSLRLLLKVAKGNEKEKLDF